MIIIIDAMEVPASRREKVRRRISVKTAVVGQWHLRLRELKEAELEGEELGEEEVELDRDQELLQDDDVHDDDVGQEEDERLDDTGQLSFTRDVAADDGVADDGVADDVAAWQWQAPSLRPIRQ